MKNRFLGLQFAQPFNIIVSHEQLIITTTTRLPRSVVQEKKLTQKSTSEHKTTEKLVLERCGDARK
jgi:hypothetical protein